MLSHMLNIVADNARLRAADKIITGADLRRLVTQNNFVVQTIERLSRRYNRRILEALLQIEPVVEQELGNRESAARIATALEAVLNTDDNDTVRYTVGMEPARSALTVSIQRYGLEETIGFPASFFNSTEYQSLIAHITRLKNVGERFVVEWGNNEEGFDRFSESVEWMMARAKKGLSIQRYKGLGEMNPEQLWETTMDPAVRRLLQVTIEDAVGADETFTTLMGDHVEPRREFIEKNAFAVSNLDV